MYPIKQITHEKEPNMIKFIWYYMKKNLKLILLEEYIKQNQKDLDLLHKNMMMIYI